jgi:cobalt/nickel transport system permease protein
MHFDLTDQYQPRGSFLHRLDPRVKVVSAVLFILAAGLVPVGSWPAFAVLAALAIAASTASGLGWAYAVRRSYVALPFALVALPLLFTTPGEPLMATPWLGMAVTAQGMERFASLLLRSWIAIQAAILLAATTPFIDILWALGALRMPRMLVVTIGVMFRYFFVLADETARMIRARASRSASPVRGRRPSAVWQGRVAGHMVGSLFLRALERSERVYDAMLARGYDGRAVSLARRRMRRVDWLAVTGAGLLLAGLVAWAQRF